ncbi:MAG: phosphoglycerate kinase [Saprospiraceae bacterium]|nr:phosphoglycerate kinase [Saprospiraceae bacterium]
MKSLNFKDKKVLVRVDFNVPLNEDGEVTDDTRIRRALPTINYILDRGGSVILMSHLGRPLSKLNEDGTINKSAFSLLNLKEHLNELLDNKVFFAEDCGGEESRKKAGALEPGQVLLLENTRFNKGEKQGDDAFAKKLADLADIFINDAFGAAHRAHASTTTIAKFFDKEHKAFGLLMQSELENGQKVLLEPKAPFVAIVGGAKVSDKIPLVRNLLDSTNDICIGGGMAYTFLAARGYEVGDSLVEQDKIEMASEILELAMERSTKIHLPMDSVIAEEFSPKANFKVTENTNIQSGWMGLDIGPKTISYFTDVILKAKTIVWNGPMGVFEFDACNKGTFAIAQAVAGATEEGAFSLVGGGDSVSAINKSGLSAKVSFVSTGGGAMLELLEGKTLPGVAAITE